MNASSLLEYQSGRLREVIQGRRAPSPRVGQAEFKGGLVGEDVAERSHVQAPRGQTSPLPAVTRSRGCVSQPIRT